MLNENEPVWSFPERHLAETAVGQTSGSFSKSFRTCGFWQPFVPIYLLSTKNLILNSSFFNFSFPNPYTYDMMISGTKGQKSGAGLPAGGALTLELSEY